MSARINIFIRAVASVTGDITIGYAMASACIWVIQAAALGIFLSFLLWLLTIIASLAFSQHALHPGSRSAALRPQARPRPCSRH